ncbi:MAG: hypothetical protein WC208_06475 [Gallionella sp.]|jgi:hypothetical protein
MNTNIYKAALVLLFYIGTAHGQMLVSGTNEGKRAGTEQNIQLDVYGFGADVQIEGVAVINDKVYIDGVRVPKGTRVFTSKKTGRHYLIEWGENDNVTVREK